MLKAHEELQVLPPGIIQLIVQAWDRKENLNPIIQAWWELASTACREEIRHNYELETEVQD